VCDCVFDAAGPRMKMLGMKMFLCRLIRESYGAFPALVVSSICFWLSFVVC